MQPHCGKSTGLGWHSMVRWSRLPRAKKEPRPNPTDRGKGGIKRILLTDAYGIPLAVVIDGANCHDMKLAKPILESLAIPRPSLLRAWPQRLCMDKGFDSVQIQHPAVELS
jgi:hypothetical protein